LGVNREVNRARCRSLNQERMTHLLERRVPGLTLPSRPPTDDELRAVLIAVARIPKFESDIRAALEYRLLVSVTGTEPLLLATLLLLLLSTKWRIKVRQRNGRWDFEFEAGKAATPLSLLRSLLAGLLGTRGPDGPRT
jgi:hypothetical protein